MGQHKRNLLTLIHSFKVPNFLGMMLSDGYFKLNLKKCLVGQEWQTMKADMDARAAELVIANEEKSKRAAELVIANEEKSKRAAELVIANEEKSKRAAELVITNEKFVIENAEKSERVAELVIANQERKKLTSVVEQSPNMVFITDTTGIIEYANAKFYEVTGYVSEEVLGQTSNIIQSGHTPPSVYKELWQCIKAGKVWKGEIEDRRKDGSFFWAEVTIAPISSKDGGITHYFSSHENITTRKDAESKMREAIDLANIANRTKSDLMANMSHELRTPLNAIIGFSAIMLEETFGSVGSDKNREYLNDIHQSGEHLLGLINDILDVSAIEAGAVELFEENVSLSKVVDVSVRLIQPRADTGQVTVTSAIDPKLPQIYVDERRVKQILLNLLSNAVKFTQEGGEILVSSRLNDDGSLSLTVSDTGMGIEEHEVKKAMSKFGQVDSGLDRKHEGTGLGLPLTLGLVELHGGTFDVKSEKGFGTTITVTFPMDRVG